MSEFLERVSSLQTELKAPKGQTNKFGGYRYRSCEDILEAVKPLLKKYQMTLTLSDNLEYIGDRYYIHATATLFDTQSDGKICNSAFAREAESKKGMDDSQITGTASSYARKYALNGLFCIDDTKDADTDEFTIAQRQKDILCEECGKVVYPARKKDGSIWNVEDMSIYSKRRFGRYLCADCMKQQMKKEDT